jgi:nickel-dependent lactate racemase
MTRTTMPWKMWHGPEQLALDWPAGWDVRVCRMSEMPALGDEAIAHCVDSPIGCPPLGELARGRGDCCILVDDTTRPTPAGRILPRAIEILADAGIPRRRIAFLVANATHRAQTRADLLRKLGPAICDEFAVMRHDPYQNVTEVDVEGTTIQVNAHFMAAELKLAVTGLMPHFMCGYSGGAKIVMPGACGMETVAATHAHTVEGPPAKVGIVEGNRMRAAMEACAERVGLAWAANAVFNERGELCGLHCGNPREAHAAAVAQAQRVNAVRVPYGSDVAVFNAFPKDTEFIQTMAALNLWADRRNPARALVRPGGSIVVVCACTEGLGAHGLIEFGRRQFVRRDRHGSFKDVLAGRELLFLAPNVSPATVELYYGPRARPFRDWPSLRAALEALHPRGATAAVFPSSALAVDAEFLQENGCTTQGA